MVGFTQEEATAFWKRAEINEDPVICWRWKPASSERWYGQVYHKGKHYGAHRVAWSLFFDEPIPAGQFVCHSCDHRWCVNPFHLWLGTARDNIRDAVAKHRFHTLFGMNGRYAPRPPVRSHCSRGHPLSDENLAIRIRLRRGRPITERTCRICNRARQRSSKGSGSV
jgi:hypothetical protein